MTIELTVEIVKSNLKKIRTTRDKCKRELSSHTLEQSPCYPIIDKRRYNNDNGSGRSCYCKLHPDIQNVNLESIEHHCKDKDHELHKPKILKI
jgi:hypothetical protein